MKAMVFAAGLGTRLRPLTDTLPKALVPVGGKPMLAHVLQRLKSFGFDDVIINVHHFAEQILHYLEVQQNFGMKLNISHEEDRLLDTGGGLKQAAWFFDDGQPFLVHNVDVVTDLDLAALYKSHLQSQMLVTLAVKQRQTSRYFLFDRTNTLCGWQNITTGETRIARMTPEAERRQFAFSGIHVISPAIFALMPSNPIFSLIPFYLDVAATHSIKAFRHDHAFWLDLGKKDSLAEAEQYLGNHSHQI